MNKRQKVIVAIVGVLFLLMLNKYLYGPIDAKIRKLKSELKTRQMRYALLSERAERLEELRKNYALLQARIQDAERKLPREKDLPQLLRAITSAGKRFKVEISEVQPKQAEPGDFYTAFPFTISVEANYHNLAQFMAEIGQYERIFHVKNLDLVPIMEDEGQTLKGISASFQLYAYTYREKEEKLEGKKGK